MVSAGDMVLGEDMALEGACLMQGLHHMVMLGTCRSSARGRSLCSANDPGAGTGFLEEPSGGNKGTAGANRC